MYPLQMRPRDKAYIHGGKCDIAELGQAVPQVVTHVLGVPVNVVLAFQRTDKTQRSAGGQVDGTRQLRQRKAAFGAVKAIEDCEGPFYSTYIILYSHIITSFYNLIIRSFMLFKPELFTTLPRMWLKAT